MRLFNRKFLCDAITGPVVLGYTYDRPPSGLRIYRFRYPLYFSEPRWDYSFSDEILYLKGNKTKLNTIDKWNELLNLIPKSESTYDQTANCELRDYCERVGLLIPSVSYAYVGLLFMSGDTSSALFHLNRLYHELIELAPEVLRNEIKECYDIAMTSPSKLSSLFDSRILNNTRIISNMAR